MRNIVKNATVKIEVSSSANPGVVVATCSGFFTELSNGMAIISCAHAFYSRKRGIYGDTVKIHYWKTGAKKDLQIGLDQVYFSFDYEESNLDLSCIRWNGETPDSALYIRREIAVSGESFYVCGHGDDANEWHVRKAQSMSNQLFDKHTYLLCVGNGDDISPGDSGGPIMDESGRCIAIMSCGYETLNEFYGCSLYSKAAYKIMGEIS